MHFSSDLPLRLLLFPTILSLLLLFLSFNSVQGQYDVAPCPLNFTVLQSLIQSSARSNFDNPTACRYVLQGLHLVQSLYLKSTGFFLSPINSSASCWTSYQSVVNDFVSDFNITRTCGFQTTWISEGCQNVSTKAQFESLIPNSTLADVVSSCNTTLEDNSPCATCTTALSNTQVYLPGPSIGNVTECTNFPFLYAAAFANYLGPTDHGTAKCLFYLDFSASSSSSSKKKKTRITILLVIIVALALGFIGMLVWWKRRRNEAFKKRVIEMNNVRGTSHLDSIVSQSTNLVRFSLDDIKECTRNFSRENIIGRGGYGNVYRGVLPDGTEVAVKRFKNCSAAGDENFAHEVEVIASVRHVNLVGLIGYCTATTPFEGHQRIIVCDLLKNGSVYDHLFDSSGEKLSWPLRQKIALGTARGLAYLHYGAQPAIIHRDIKASNILLDERFEAKVADFGLAKFTPEGMTHVSTRVAGTMGYVAPEYALYGQLTDRSDVYSFGVLLLELLSGKKALVIDEEGQACVVTDWAWSLVKRGRALDVVEDGMPEIGTPEIMEKYVLAAVLCSHPERYARPTMDQVVKILESDIPMPAIPERPVSFVANLDDIERSTSSGGSDGLSTPRGFQTFTSGSSYQTNAREDKGPGARR